MKKFKPSSNNTDASNPVHLEARPFKRHVRLNIIISTAIADFFAIIIGMLLVSGLYLGKTAQENLFFIILTLILYFFASVRRRLFTLNTITSASRSTRLALFSFTTSALIAISVMFLTKSWSDLSRFVIVFGSGVSTALLVISRYLLARWSYRALDGNPEAP